MGDAIKVSIILPTRNGARYLKQSIDSCLAQTFSDLELIVINDGSVDATADILASYQDPRVRVILHEVNQGIVASLNHGFAESRGELLTWTSDDNIYTPKALEVMATALEADASLGMVYAVSNVIDEEGRFIKTSRVLEPKELDEDNCVGGCFMYRRTVYQAIGGYSPEAFLAEDYEYWLKVRARFKMKKLDDVLYEQRQHPLSLTMTHRVEEVQEKVHQVRKAYVSAVKYACFEAERALRQGRRGVALSKAIQACVLGPLYYPSWRLLAVSSLPTGMVDQLRQYVRHRRLHPKK
jgi:glycosyltransferase involved in cell wall biosynthesis